MTSRTLNPFPFPRLKINRLLRCRIAFKRTEGEKVGIGQVGDVDVVTDAGAVGGRVIVTIDTDRLAATQGHVEDERDEMGFRLMCLASGYAFGALGRAGHVEVAQRGGPQAVDAMHPGKHLLDEEL